jgi:HAE1 family hydrophobic/amphiphilic exporter-1
MNSWNSGRAGGSGRARGPFLLLAFGLVAWGPFVALPLRAEDPAPANSGGSLAPATPRVLTLAEALALADERSFDVRKAAENRDWVQGKYLEERAAVLPQVSLKGDTRWASDETYSALSGGLFPSRQDSRGLELTVDQLVFAWGKVDAALNAARIGIGGAEHQLLLSKQIARRDAGAAFHDVLLARELASIAEASLAQRQRHLEEAKGKRALGAATEYDVLAAEVAVANSRPEAIRAANLVRTARHRLAFVLGRENEELDAAGSLDLPRSEPPSYEAALATALERRPDLKLALARTKILGEVARIVRAGDKPRIDFAGSWAHRWLDFGGVRADADSWAAGLYLKVPLFDGFRTKGQLAEALSDLSAAELDLAKLREAAALEIRAAVDAVGEADSIVAALEGTVAQAEKLLSMAETGFGYGVKTRLEVDDAELNLRLAKANLAKAKRDRIVAGIELDRARGTLGE